MESQNQNRGETISKSNGKSDNNNYSQSLYRKLERMHIYSIII